MISEDTQPLIHEECLCNNVSVPFNVRVCKCVLTYTCEYSKQSRRMVGACEVCGEGVARPHADFLTSLWGAMAERLHCVYVCACVCVCVFVCVCVRVSVLCVCMCAHEHTHTHTHTHYIHS